MKKIIYLITGLCISCASWSQGTVFNDPVSSRVFNSEKYSGINGSPFLYDTWLKGSVTTAKGTYKNQDLKLDVYAHTLFFKRNDEPYEFVDEINSFTLVLPDGDTAIFKNGFIEAGLKTDQFVQVLQEGRVSLYRSDIKSLTEKNVINQGVIKNFNSTTRYFVRKNNQLQLIKLNKNEVSAIVQDKAGQTDAYINENKLNLRKEADVTRLIRYYNTL